MAARTAARSDETLTAPHAATMAKLHFITFRADVTLASLLRQRYAALAEFADLIARTAEARGLGGYDAVLWQLVVVHLRGAAAAPDTTARQYHLEAAVNEACAANMTAPLTSLAA